jgi:subtilisin-like proprotein convertase family protein
MTVNYVPPRVAATRLGVSGRKCQLGDLEIYLIAPNHQQILLQSRTLGRRNQLQNTYTVRSHPALK